MTRPQGTAPALRRSVGAGLCTLALFVQIGLLAGGGCQAARPGAERPQGTRVTLDVVPLILPADTASVATIWVTVLEEDSPAADSTRVSLVATAGTVPAEVYTRDGLGRAAYQACGEAGVVTVIAQAKGVRDSINITLY
jgi:hypothetical protein